MCINATVSIVTFISSSILCLYLYKRNNVNDRVLATWIFVFSLIQLVEYLMWMDYDNKYNLNNIATKMGLLLILLQPLVLSVGMLYYGKMYTNKTIKIFIKVLIAILAAKVILTAFYIYSTWNENWSSKMGPNCHLIWHFSRNKENMPWYTHIGILFFGPLAFFMSLIKPYPSNLLYMLFGGSTLLYTYIFKGLETGSYWCLLGNIMPILAILFNTDRY